MCYSLIQLLYNSFHVFPLNMSQEMKLSSSHFSFLLHSLKGEFGYQWLARDLSLCGWPGCDEGGCHQCRPGNNGERGQGLPQTGKGEPDGRLEVLHLLWFPGVPSIDWVEVYMGIVVTLCRLWTQRFVSKTMLGWMSFEKIGEGTNG